MAADDRAMLIDGDWTSGSAGTSTVVNPATEAVVGTAPEGSVADARSAAAAAHAAFEAWSRTAPARRGELLAQTAAALVAREATLTPLIVAETGCTEAVAAMQIRNAVDRLRFYAESTGRPLTHALVPSPMSATPQAPGALMGAVVQPVPIGVVACIVPYNAPLSMMAGKTAAALAMGNTVVMKPPHQNPLTIIELARIMDAVGFPPGVVNLVSSVAPDPAAALVADPHVDMISFTGSISVGSEIAATAGRSLKRTLLELGGKGAAIVFEDADMAPAVRTLSTCWSFYSGQICQAPSRAIVHRSRADELIERLTAIGRGMPVGDPLDPATVVGPVISAAQRDRVEAYVAGARRDGAEIAVGGERPDRDRGYYVAPTLLVGCSPDMAVAREEIFGPVISVLTFDTEDEAIALANDTEYGLYDYVFSRDTKRAYELTSRLRSGGVGINTNQRHMEAPFGGLKKSGLGREGGVYSLHEYLEWQTVSWPG